MLRFRKTQYRHLKKGRLLQRTALLMAVLTLLAALPAWGLGASAAATPTSLGLAMQGVTAHRDGWIYVYGGKGGVVEGNVRATDCAGLLYSYYSDCGVSGCAGGATSQVRQNTVFSGSVSLGLPRIHGLALTNSEPGGYSHIGIYIGNNESCDNSMEGINMVRASVQERHWDGWHIFDLGTQYPRDGWFEFDGRMVHYTSFEYDVDTEVDGYKIGSDGFAYLEDGTPAPVDKALLSNNWASATEVANYLRGQGWTGSDDPEDIPFDHNALVNGTSVNLRSEPTTRSSSVALLGKNTRVLAGAPVTGEKVTVTKSGSKVSTDLWYPATTASGKTGYICSLYLDIDIPAPELSCDGESVTLTAGEFSDDIYYTTDGADPAVEGEGFTLSTTPYVSPVYQLGCTYKAAVIRNGLVGPVTTVSVTSNGAAFTDFQFKDWFAVHVDRAVTLGIFSGSGDRKFEPNSDIIRAQFVAVLSNLAKVDLDQYSLDSGTFTDVPANAYYTRHLAWAVENGIVAPGGKFEPNQVLPREQMCLMLDKFMSNVMGVAPLDVSNVERFSDDNKISPEAKDAVYRMRELGVISGTGNNKFDPAGTSKRCTASTVAVQFHDKVMERYYY